MKHVFLRSLLLTAALTCAAADRIDVSIEPQPVTVGEPADLVLTAEGRDVPAFAGVPKVSGLEWLGQSSSIRQHIVNGRYAGIAERRYSFIVEKPGDYTIPKFSVKAGRKTIEMEPVSFTAEKATLRTSRTSRQEGLEIDKVVFSEFRLPKSGKTYYAGEYIPVEVDVYCLSGVRVNLSYPKITAENDNIVFRNFRNSNPENHNFERPGTFLARPNTASGSAQEYIGYRFRTEISTLSAGKFKLSSETPVQIQVPASPSRRSSRDPFFDDFFDSGFFSRTVRHTASSESNEIIVKPLPPPPEQESRLGLVGKWKITPKLSGKETTVGNAVTLHLKITGTGSLETLSAPEIKNEDFRVYSPEITRDPDGRSAEIRYIMIPVKAGELTIAQKFCYFDTGAGKYESIPIAFTVKVGEGTAVIQAPKQPNVVDSALPEPEKRTQPTHALAGIMYLKPLPASGTCRSIPLYGTVFFCLLGIILFALCEIIAKHRRERNSGAERRAAARKSKKNLLDRLKKTPPERIYDLAPDVAEYLNNALDLPPGTSLDEIADGIGQKEPELARHLKELSLGAWAPGSTGFSEERKHSLMKHLGKIICLALCFAGCSLFAAPSGEEDALQAYDKGNFAEARQWYTAQLEKTAASPALLYDIGNCFYQEKKFADALLCYEKAFLLSPRDPEIRRNLNLARRELGLPAKFTMETPADLPAALRDNMTPDEWFLLASIGFCILMTGFGLRRFFGFRTSFTAAAAGAILLILGIAMAVSEKMTTFSDERGITVGSGVPLRNLPSESSASVTAETLKPGEEISIREKRKDWIRVKAGDAIGWVPSKDVKTVSGTDLSGL